MVVRVYGIKNCDTMKKALAWLESRNIKYDFHDYKRAGVPSGKLREWAGKAGWENLVNSRGPTWRKIADAEKQELDETKALALLEQHSSAIRRPIVEAGSRLLIGFDEREFSRIA